MKKYSVTFPIFLFLIFVLLFFVYRNYDISKSINFYMDVKQLTHEIEVLSIEQTLNSSSIDKKINYDNIVEVDQKFKQRFEFYVELLLEVEDKKLVALVKEIKRKRTVLEYVYEDIKTDNALVKNSRLWLSKSYNTYVLQEDTTVLDTKLMQYLFNVMHLSITNNIDAMSQFTFENSIDEVLNRHLKLIYKKQKNLMALHKKLQENDFVSDLNRVTLHTSKHLNKLQSERDSIISILFLVTAFLIIFGLYAYSREVLTSIEMNKVKNELEHFFNALNESVIVSKTDLYGKMTYVNDAFCDVTGYKREELLGKKHTVIGHSDTNADVFKTIWTTIREKNTFKSTLKNSKKDGSSYYVDTIIMPFTNVDGVIYEYISIQYEVTELINSRNSAITANKVKNEFLANMSHELRTPLNSINGFSSILLRQIKDEKQVKYLKNIMESSTTLVHLINDILDLSKLQNGKFALECLDFRVDAKVEKLLEKFEIQIKNAELHFIATISKSARIALHGDWMRISQIISNLLSNAIKFTPKKNKIMFDIAYINSFLTIKVEDEGIGMREDAQAKIFQAFEQADSSTTKKYGGTGLGLSIVINLIEQMNGRITLHSEEGKGSVFEVFLPLDEVSMDDFYTLNNQNQ
ncbi:PAS domain S-box protein [Sulfurimonas sp. SAG-AH-194-I05]|nr:ATP-binding protein [Sulfurimonas sp. SAG-AH-194-I05]MDF1875376.1 PAS domain S-box protein [Sulfurimonas sp. SAG-AH-194-I05]